jgi:hypothetical protein
MTRKTVLLDACCVGAAVAAAGWIFAQWQGAFRTLLLAALALALVAYLFPRLGVRLLDHLIHRVRAFHWRHEQGRHHAFAGIPLHINDDGRHVWVDGEGLQRVLGSHDSDEVLAARHAGRWRRDHQGRLQLRVDTVVDVLAKAPGRLDPRTVRLRRYFEREVLFPAAERRRRSTP